MLSKAITSFLVLSTAIGIAQAAQPDKECGKIKQCYLVNLDTSDPAKPLANVGTPVAPGKLTKIDMQSSKNGWSLRCVGQGKVHYVKYFFGNKKVNTHYSNPFWANGDNSGTYVNSFDFLNDDCGAKTIDVRAYTWSGTDKYPCSSTKLMLESPCGSKGASKVNEGTCTNRGSGALYSKKVGPNNLKGCTDWVKSNSANCGASFEYGEKDGLCSCTPQTQCSLKSWPNYYAYNFNADKTEYTFIQAHRYCGNRGLNRGGTLTRKRFAANSLASCVAWAQKNPACGHGFNYGLTDGWCDCTKSTVCTAAPKANYATYKLDFTDTPKASQVVVTTPAAAANAQVKRTHKGMSCLNRGTGSKYSKKVAANNIKACADWVRSNSLNCGVSFDYSDATGICTCVPKKTTTCKLRGYPNYFAYNFKAGDKTKFSLVKERNYCVNRGLSKDGYSTRKRFAANNLDACVAWAQTNPNCGDGFNYGKTDGWCDCVKAPSSDCAPTSKAQYDVYELVLSNMPKAQQIN